MPPSLRSLLPKFHLVEGCYLLELDEGVADSNAVQQELELYKGDRRRFEEDSNRCFVIRNLLDSFGVDYKILADDDLLAIAEMVAAVFRDGLRNHFPEGQFDVEIIGGNLVDDEPLELCVTFARSGR